MTTVEALSAVEPSRPLIDALLEDQQRATAVERFSRAHDSKNGPAQAKYYRDLIPLTAPSQGEQYAFEVDLDACTGCKACVTACHNLNGLEEDELWRSVGFLHGGTSDLPVIQHVTTACHHCLEPACLHGCPVNAYEKDPVTGIVRHLDDQCIGCRYCMLKCPYDVPQYSNSKGIVRKCDMCRDRLAVDEAPACVQACPNRAIRIRIVDTQTVVEESEGNQFLPCAPEPGYTIPTTVYRTQKPLARNLLPADYYSARPGHSHLPLVFMLVLTQMSVGAFVVDQAVFSYFSLFGDPTARLIRPMHLAAALLLGILGLGASVFHLGRPLYAFRAVLGLRTSWLSREIVAFNAFAATATTYVGVACMDYFGRGAPAGVEAFLGLFAALTGLGAVLCSVMIYVDTRRPFWNGSLTSAKFLLTAVVLGIPTALLIPLFVSAFTPGLATRQFMAEFGAPLCRILIVATVAKLLVEALIFASLRHKQHTPLKRTALLMTGELSMTVLKRYFFGIVGGVVLPLVLIAEPSIASQEGFQPLFVLVAVVLMLSLLTTGELLERYLFFTASVAPKMPGARAT